MNVIRLCLSMGFFFGDWFTFAVLCRHIFCGHDLLITIIICVVVAVYYNPIVARMAHLA